MSERDAVRTIGRAATREQREVIQTMAPRKRQPSVPVGDRVGRYLRSIQSHPLLSAAEERALAERLVAQGDDAAAERLINSHLRLVARIASGYRGYGMPLEDLISQGNLGLVQAVQRFDPQRGFRLSTYAMWWIRAAIQEYIVHSWSLVKMGTTSEQKKLFFNLRRIKGRIGALEEGDLAPDLAAHIAAVLKVPQNEVIHMNRRLAATDASLNAPVSGESDSEWQDWLVDADDDPESDLEVRQLLAERRQLLSGALDQLNERERRIVSDRHLRERPLTLEELSHQFGISRERVRQLEMAALAKLKKTVMRATTTERRRADAAAGTRRGRGTAAA